MKAIVTGLIVLLCVGAAPPQRPERPRLAANANVRFTFARSPFSDWLFYLLFRSTNDFPQLKAEVALDGVTPIDDSFLPQDAMLSSVSRYDQLYKLSEKHENPDALKAMLRTGEPHFVAFSAFWNAHIGPDEDRTIAAWEREARAWPPIRHLESLERLKFPFAAMQIDVFALEPSGGSMQAPPTIFTSTRVSGLAWVVGHEGTHMMLEKAADWVHRPGANEARRRMRDAGGSDYAIEEALCLLMQAKLSIAAGKTPPAFRSSDELPAKNPSRRLLLALERDWPSYLRNSRIDAADWLIAETIRTYSAG